jgi:hypothetical protein
MAVDIAPPSGDLHVGFVDLPAITDGVAAGPGGLGQQRREALDPAVDRDVVDLDAAFGQQLLDVAVGQREAQVPAHGQHDHISWEAEAGERRACDGRGSGRVLMATVCLLEARSQQLQQSRLVPRRSSGCACPEHQIQDLVLFLNGPVSRCAGRTTGTARVLSPSTPPVG